MFINNLYEMQKKMFKGGEWVGKKKKQRIVLKISLIGWNNKLNLIRYYIMWIYMRFCS